MFREISRNKQQVLSEEQSMEILEKATSGVLSVLGDSDYPYGVPISYALRNNKLYFHGMPKGHKIDAIRKHEKVSFTVIETDQVVAEEYTTYFRSVIVFGKAKIIEAPDAKREALNYLVEKYAPDFIEESEKEIDAKLKGVCIFVLEIEHVSGKEAIEFARQRG